MDRQRSDHPTFHETGASLRAGLGDRIPEDLQGKPYIQLITLIGLSCICALPHVHLGTNGRLLHVVYYSLLGRN